MSEDTPSYNISAPGRRASRVDAPARDEMRRAKELAAWLASAISRARHFDADRVSLPVDDAEELCQLLHDSLRTAEQIRTHSQRKVNTP